MAKELLKLLETIDNDLAKLGLASNVFTLSSLIYTHSAGVTRTGQLKFQLDDVLAALTMANRRLNKVVKLEKRIEILEKKAKKWK